MNIYYLNDEKHVVTIQVNGQLRPSPTNPYGEPTIDVFRLQPQEGKMFFVDAPEGAIPWIKRWETRVVLLTYIRAEEAQQYLTPSQESSADVPSDT